MMTMMTQFSAGTPMMNFTTGRRNSSEIDDSPIASPIGMPISSEAVTAMEGLLA